MWFTAFAGNSKIVPHCSDGISWNFFFSATDAKRLRIILEDDGVLVLVVTAVKSRSTVYHPAGTRPSVFKRRIRLKPALYLCNPGEWEKQALDSSWRHPEGDLPSHRRL